MFKLLPMWIQNECAVRIARAFGYVLWFMPNSIGIKMRTGGDLEVGQRWPSDRSQGAGELRDC